MKHIKSINSRCHLPVHKHFWSNCSLVNFKCFIIDSSHTTSKLKIKESNYIKKFKTRQPNGFNVIENFTPNPSLILPFNEISFKLTTNIKRICNNKNIDVKSVYRQGKTLAQHFN